MNGSYYECKLTLDHGINVIVVLSDCPIKRNVQCNKNYDVPHDLRPTTFFYLLTHSFFDL